MRGVKAHELRKRSSGKPPPPPSVTHHPGAFLPRRLREPTTLQQNETFCVGPRRAGRPGRTSNKFSNYSVLNTLASTTDKWDSQNSFSVNECFKKFDYRTLNIFFPPDAHQMPSREDLQCIFMIHSMIPVTAMATVFTIHATGSNSIIVTVL